MQEYFWLLYALSECEADQLLCQSGDVCFPANNKCDDRFDCEDGSDEIDCGKFAFYGIL